MNLIIGIVVVFGCVLGGFAVHGGHLGALWQPSELLIIGGAAIGALIIANPMRVTKKVAGGFGTLLKGARYKKDHYLNLFAVMYELLSLARKEGMMGLERVIEEPAKSEVFKKRPLILNDHHVVEFIQDYLRLIISGDMDEHQLEALMDQEIETHHHDGEEPARKTEDVNEKLDNERLAGLLEALREAIDERESLTKFKDQILLDVTPEGVRIQIIDHERRSMFPLGSARLEDFSSDILKELAHIVSSVPNRISISGHTDVKPYVAVNYTNWELSADPPNAARRALLAGGLAAEKIGRVVGLASSVLLDPSAPQSPVNRRISIVVMNKRTEAAISAENGNLLMVQETGASPAPGGEPVARQ